MEALRLAIPPPSVVPVITDPSAVPSTAVPPPVAPIGPGMSPDRLFDTAYADYTAGQYSLAVQGFDSYLRSFPKGNRADEAQYYIAASYDLDSKDQEAIEAYGRVNPSSKMAPQAYYRRGRVYQRLKQIDSAKQSFEMVIKQFPNDAAALLAKQALDTFNAPAR
jgi:TolA-binding protein